MRWLAAIAAVLFLTIGALFGVGYFLLPYRAAVSEEVTIERPAASVHAILENLRTFNEWSPWYAADPKAEYVINGDAGIGQKATWRSKIASVGRGTHRIVASREFAEVDSVIDFADRGSANLAWTITPAPKGVKVKWTFSSTCTPSPWRVPCRYVSLISRRSVSTDLNFGLERLKVLAEKLPNVDFAGLKPEFVIAAPQQFAYVENDVRRKDPPNSLTASPDGATQAALDAAYAKDVATAISASLQAVLQALKASNSPTIGPPVLVTMNSTRNQISFRVGYPYGGSGPAEDPRVTTGQTPQGKAIKVVHNGPDATLQDTYRMIDAYMRAHRMQRASGSWEVRDPSQRRTEIYVPID